MRQEGAKRAGKKIKTPRSGVFIFFFVFSLFFSLKVFASSKPSK
jgi:hypothetical protein